MPLKYPIFPEMSWKYGFNIIRSRGIRIWNRILNTSTTNVSKSRLRINGVRRLYGRRIYINSYNINKQCHFFLYILPFFRICTPHPRGRKIHVTSNERPALLGSIENQPYRSKHHINKTDQVKYISYINVIFIQLQKCTT